MIKSSLNTKSLLWAVGFLVLAGVGVWGLVGHRACPAKEKNAELFRRVVPGVANIPRVQKISTIASIRGPAKTVAPVVVHKAVAAIYPSKIYKTH